jgi:hypothetical protein
MPVIPTFKKLRQKDHEFNASIGNTSRPCLKQQQKTNKQTKPKVDIAVKILFRCD